MAEARASLESRMAVLEDTLDALAEQLEAVARDGANTTRDQLREVAASITALERRVDATAGEQVERLVARLQEDRMLGSEGRTAADAPRAAAALEAGPSTAPQTASEPRRILHRRRP